MVKSLWGLRGGKTAWMSEALNNTYSTKKDFQCIVLLPVAHIGVAGVNVMTPITWSSYKPHVYQQKTSHGVVRSNALQETCLDRQGDRLLERVSEQGRRRADSTRRAGAGSGLLLTWPSRSLWRRDQLLQRQSLAIRRNRAPPASQRPVLS